MLKGKKSKGKFISNAKQRLLANNPRHINIYFSLDYFLKAHKDRIRKYSGAKTKPHWLHNQ